MGSFDFVYDVPVNWADGTQKSYLIPQYHEWYKDDEVEVFGCLPVVLVEPELYTYIEQEYDEIPQTLLNLVFNKAEQKVDGVLIKANYVFIVTDGERMLAVDTDDEHVPNYKSYLTPKTASFVIDRLRKIHPLKLQWEAPKKRELNKTDQLSADLLLLDDKYVVGLTRAEKDMKAILMTYLYTLVTSTNKDEVRYWYSEVFRGTFDSPKVKRMRKETMVRQMFEELKEGWDERHVSLGDELTRHHDIFADGWKECKKRQKELVKSK